MDGVISESTLDNRVVSRESNGKDLKSEATENEWQKGVEGSSCLLGGTDGKFSTAKWEIPMVEAGRLRAVEGVE